MHLEKRGFVIFLQWPTFWDFIDTGLLNYIPSGIRICFPLLWKIFFNQVLAPSSSVALFSQIPKTVDLLELFWKRTTIHVFVFSFCILPERGIYGDLKKRGKFKPTQYFLSFFRTQLFTGVNIHSGVCFDFQCMDLRANRSYFPRNLVTICEKFFQKNNRQLASTKICSF